MPLSVEKVEVYKTPKGAKYDTEDAALEAAKREVFDDRMSELFKTDRNKNKLGSDLAVRNTHEYIWANREEIIALLSMLKDNK